MALERVVPDATPNESWLATHVARYDFASHYARPYGRLLDIACGSGHGTALVADRLPTVECVGVDLDGAAISGARQRYGRPNAHYIQSDALQFTDPTGFDTIVSLETIEHLDEPELFVARLVAILRPNGRLIASVPSTPSTDANPYHRQDFTEASFKRLFRGHLLTEVASLRLVDPFSNTPALAGNRWSKGAIAKRMLGHYAKHPAAIMRRLVATARYGFENRYITVAWQHHRGAADRVVGSQGT